MGFRVNKFSRKRWKLVCTVVCLSLFFNEGFVYWYDSLKWPHVNCLSQKEYCQKILIVSDPQILGYTKESLGWIGWTDSDRFLKKSYSHALHHVKPDVVIFLGDLMDEGSISTDKDYELYKKRFLHIFDASTFNSNVIYLPGDNDIGGEGNDHVTRFKIDRFNRHFPSKVETIAGNIQFVVVNRILGDFNLPSISKQEGKHVFVLSHIPLTFIPGIFSREVMTNLKPNVVFSAHDHRMAIATTHLNDSSFFEADHFFQNPNKITHRLINDQDCIEVIWPTCSYRMGVEKAGYGFATIGNDGEIKLGVLWIHSRFWSLYSYLVVLFCCLIIFCFPHC